MIMFMEVTVPMTQQGGASESITSPQTHWPVSLQVSPPPPADHHRLGEGSWREGAPSPGGGVRGMVPEAPLPPPDPRIEGWS